MSWDLALAAFVVIAYVVGIFLASESLCGLCTLLEELLEDCGQSRLDVPERWFLGALVVLVAVVLMVALYSVTGGDPEWRGRFTLAVLPVAAPAWALFAWKVRG